MHVVQRGHNRAPCFFDDSGRRLYLGLMTQFAAKHDCAVHAYVLMTNHVHMLVTPRTPFAVSRLMKDVNQRYVQHVNRKSNRTGSLWQGRYWCSLVDSGNYVLACYRYIERNPVRAGMTTHAAGHPWSSHATNALGRPSALITSHEAYQALGDDAAARREAYKNLFERRESKAELDRIRKCIASGLPYGSAPFLAHLETCGVPVEKGKSGRPCKARPAVVDYASLS
jgi:REP-associated tyrosine transposase